jgi:hypothetical protein
MEKNSNNTVIQTQSPDKSNTNNNSEAIKIQQKALSPASEDFNEIDDENLLKTTETVGEFNAARFEAQKGLHGHSMSMIPMNTVKHETKDEIWQSTLLQTQNVSSVSNKFGIPSIKLCIVTQSTLQILNKSGRSIDSTVTSMTFEKRLKYYCDKYKTNVAMGQIDEERKEKSDCTFKPKTTKGLSRSQSECKGFSNFLKNQYEYADKKAQKVDLTSRSQYVKEQELLKLAPTINPKSLALSAKRKKEGNKSVVFTRLHSNENNKRKRIEQLERLEQQEQIEEKPRPKKRALNKSLHIAGNRHLKEHINFIQPEPKLTEKKDANYIIKKINKNLRDIFVEFAGNADAKADFMALCNSF